MGGFRHAVAIIALAAACERHADKPLEDKAAPETCLADELGTLREGWDMLDECETDSEACRAQCRDGDGDACFHLAITVQASRLADPRAHELFLRSCKLGLATGCTNWAAAAWVKTLGPSRQCLTRVFENTCASGDSFGCGMVGRILIEARTSAVDLIRGQVYLTLACAQHAATCNLLAMYYDDETFGPPDPAKAAALRKQACEGGNDSECVAKPSDAN